MLARLILLALLLGIPAGAQDEEDHQSDDDRPIELDLSHDYDPEELREHNLMEWLRFKQIWGPIGVAGYHLPPAALPGPYLGPPRVIWSNGWGTSLWRDPVTGWPLQ